jgi:hypothetical protein
MSPNPWCQTKPVFWQWHRGVRPLPRHHTDSIPMAASSWTTAGRWHHHPQRESSLFIQVRVVDGKEFSNGGDGTRRSTPTAQLSVLLQEQKTLVSWCKSSLFRGPQRWRLTSLMCQHWSHSWTLNSWRRRTGWPWWWPSWSTSHRSGAALQVVCVGGHPQEQCGREWTALLCGVRVRSSKAIFSPRATLSQPLVAWPSLLITIAWRWWWLLQS